MAIKFGFDQTNSPAPLWWRRLERAYIIVFAPGLTGFLATWGDARDWDGDEKALVAGAIIFSTAMVKFVGMLIGSEQDYPDAPKHENE